MKRRAKTPDSTPPGESLSFTEARRAFGQVLDRVAEGSVITITRHGRPVAVLVPATTYEHLLAHQMNPLASVRESIDEHLAKMQTPEAPAGIDALFAATPGTDPLAALRARFDERFAKMQTPEFRAGIDALFAATPEELGRAAVKAAQARKDPK